MDDIAITFAVLVGIVLLFVWGRVPVEIVAVGAALVLWGSGVLTLEQSLGGFGDPVVLFIAALFVVSESLDSTGVTTWAGQELVARTRTNRTRLLILMMLVVAVLTALVTVNAAVAALLPVVVVTATRLGLAPSKLLIPLCFGAHAGSQLALTGSNVNLLVAEAAATHGGASFGFLEFGLQGIPLLLGTVLVTALVSQRLLPVRQPATISVDLSQHARTLMAEYGLVPEEHADDAVFDREYGLAEIIIPPRSPFVGETVFQGMETEAGDLVVAAIRRGDEHKTTVVLAPGDALLLQGPWDRLDARADDPGLIAVDRPDAVRRQAVPLGLRAKEALGILAAMVILLVTGLVPPAVAGLLAAGTLIVLGVVPIQRAYRAINWTTVVMVAAMLPLSTAMFQTGAADEVADALIGAVGGMGPYALLAGLFLVAAIFGQLISNTATALIMIPIGISAAGELNVDIRPVLMALSVACSASLLTPIATPVNLIAMDAAGYRFGDYWKLGLIVMLVFFVVAVFVVPVFWPF